MHDAVLCLLVRLQPSNDFSGTDIQFGEAAQAYFGKDIRSLTLAEAATLAGIIQKPSVRNPVRYPERAQARRDSHGGAAIA